MPLTSSLTPPSSAVLVAARQIDTPIGTLTLVGTERGALRIAYPHETLDEVATDLEVRLGVTVTESAGETDELARQVEQYFAGERQRFDVAVDLALVEGFARTVIEAIGDIPYGDRWSYGAVAEAVGRPRAHRAVGTACGANPLPLVFPCHRVIRSNGTVGLYGGGEHIKVALLDHEATVMAARASA